MSKVKVKAITRWQKFLAAIAGDAVAPNPVTDREKLMYNIAEKVNEGGGSGGGVLVVTDTNGTLDKTWQEIHDAMLVGGVVLSLGDKEAANISGVDYNGRSGSYVVSWCYYGDAHVGNYTASSADGYPAK